MKSTIRSIVVHSSALAAALSVLALAGCQKNGFETVYAGGDSIVSFAPSVAVTESTTKGALLNEDGTASAFPTGKTFKVSAWTGTTKSFGYDDVAYKTGGASGSYWITVYGSGPNQGKDKEYLWKQGETKSVFAYANLPTTSGAAGIENSSSASQVLTYDVSKVTTDDLQTDILMAYYTNGVTPKTDGLVPLTFYHPLTAVKFVQGTIAEGISIKSVSIEGVYPSGKTAQSSASSAFSWTKTDGTAFGTADETQTVSLSSVTVNPDTKQIGTALLLIPQAFSSSSKTRIKVVLKDAADDSKTVALYYPLNTNLGTESSPVYTSWSAGYTNTYTINFDGIVSADKPEMYNGSPLGGDSYNGHEIIDLGLSVKWATMNVGATKPEEYGEYFMWGEVKGHKPNGTGSGAFTSDFASFDHSDARYSNWNPSSGFYWVNTPFQTQNTTLHFETKYTKYLGSTSTSYKDPSASDTDALKTVLDPEDDAASVNWGGSWRMPTLEEYEELLANTISEWTEDYNGTGVKGRIFTSTKEGFTDKSIFLPAAGNGESSWLFHANEICYYWSSTIQDSNTDGVNLCCLNASAGKGGAPRYSGTPVRPVSE